MSPLKRRIIMVAVIAVTGAVLLYVNIPQSPDCELSGLVTLDGKPFGGAVLDLRGEKHSATISRVVYPGRTDADGRYRVKLQAGLIYTIGVRRHDFGKEPLQLSSGELPQADVSRGNQHFDIALSSAKSRR
jgi:hypothetical protein